MQRNWQGIWLVARREFQDQFRDWRIVIPMLLMVSIFPFVADNTTRQAVNFMNRFGGDIILDRLSHSRFWLSDFSLCRSHCWSRWKPLSAKRNAARLSRC